MRGGTKSKHERAITPGYNKWTNIGSDHAAMCFFRLMAATARTGETRAVYLSFLAGEQRLLPEIQGNKK